MYLLAIIKIVILTCILPFNITIAKSTIFKDHLFKSNVHVFERGTRNKQSLLLIHGLGTNAARDWNKVAPGFAKKYHVIMIDLPGFGKSSPSDSAYYTPTNYSMFLSSIVTKYSKSKKVIVIGHSLGGAITLSFAHNFPQLIDKIILIDTAGILHRSVLVKHLSKFKNKQVEKINFKGMLNGLIKKINQVSETIIELTDKLTPVQDFLIKTPFLRNKLAKNKIILSAAIGLIETNYSEALNSIQLPTLILWGKDDKVAPLRTARLLNYQLKNSALEFFENVGHVPMKEVPEKVLAKTLAWLAKPYFNTPQLQKGKLKLFQCKNQKNVVINKNYSEIILDKCEATLENVFTNQLIAKNSIVHLNNVSIDSSNTALLSEESIIIATGLKIKSKIGIKTTGSKMDLAGANIQANNAVLVHGNNSLIYWSVGEIKEGLSVQNIHQRKIYKEGHAVQYNK